MTVHQYGDGDTTIMRDLQRDGYRSILLTMDQLQDFIKHIEQETPVVKLGPDYGLTVWLERGAKGAEPRVESGWLVLSYCEGEQAIDCVREHSPFAVEP